MELEELIVEIVIGLFLLFTSYQIGIKDELYMKIIIDNKIPFIKEAVQRIADEVVYVPGKDFTPELVREADALIVRTRTHCNRDLLEDSRVKFIATATIGFDHIDTEYCKQAGIEWTNAPGCNSASVAQYIQSSLLVWKSCRNKKLNELTIGIIGVGNVGSKVAKVARDFGIFIPQYLVDSGV